MNFLTTAPHACSELQMLNVIECSWMSWRSSAESKSLGLHELLLHPDKHWKPESVGFLVKKIRLLKTFCDEKSLKIVQNSKNRPYFLKNRPYFCCRIWQKFPPYFYMIIIMFCFQKWQIWKLSFTIIIK